MMRRSPPGTPLPGLIQVNSEPNISGTCDADSNIDLPRKKRTHDDMSPSKDFENFRRELRADMMDMFRSWQDNQKELFKNMMESQNNVFKKLASDVAEVKAQNNEIYSTNQEIEKSMSFINKKFEELKKKVENLEKERSELNDHANDLENKLRDVQLSSRSSSIEMRNVPLKDKETHSDLMSIVSGIGRAIGCPVTSSEIRDIRRLSGKPGTTRPIVAEFGQVHAKNRFLSSARDFNRKLQTQDKLNTETIGLSGGRQPIFVAEYLSASSKRLLSLAREFAKENKYAYCWSSNGNIFLRKEPQGKQLIIRSEKCLQDLRKQE